MLRVVCTPDAALVRTCHPLGGGEIRLVRADSGALGLPIADPRISREQATVRARSDGTGCEVRDLESKNGTFVDGRRVTAAAAPFGSVVRVGDTIFEVTLEAPAVRPHPLFVGASTALLQMCADLERVVKSDASVLILGETGTGKELVAEAIHELTRRTGKLVAINCASIPPTIAESYLFGHRKGAFTGASADAPGVFEQAQDGTLFLDEVGELRVDLQAKLLRVLETRELSPIGSTATKSVNARILSATNANLRVRIAAGTFRADLFARLAGMELTTPPLRQRRSDIPLLLEHFLALAAPDARFELSTNALEALLLQPWPMNVRELRSLCTRLALAHPEGGRLRSADLLAVQAAASEMPPDPPAAIDAEPAASSSAAVPDRDELSARLREHGGSVTKLAAHYGKDRKQIYRWLEMRGLDPRDFRE
jgi:transcriptional regulator with GAF, ATPase, and Fis domain